MFSALVFFWTVLGDDFVAFSVAASANSLSNVRVDPDTGFFRDDKGRVRIFHGVNVVYKVPPWYPPSGKFTSDDSLDGQTMDLLQKWGFNVVRLGVMWPGVETAKYHYNQSYLDEIGTLSQNLAHRGLYTLVDLHQDLGFREFCGEGFPEFYLRELARDPTSNFSKASKFPSPHFFDMPVDDKGVPPLQECLKHLFSAYYITSKVGTVWRSLYTPGSELNKGFSRYWNIVAHAFSGQSHILGYELINEPSGFCLKGIGDCTDVPGLEVSNFVEGHWLTPLYQAAAKSIRSVDKETPIFFEPTPYPKITSNTFPELPLGDETQQVFAYHIYCQPDDGASRVSSAICLAAQDLFTTQYYAFLKKSRRIAGFMTEFGAVAGSPKELEHLDRLLGFADDAFQSWSYWMLKKYGDFTTANAAESLYDDGGNLNIPKLKTLSRTYAPAIAGVPISMHFEVDTAAFRLIFNATIADAETEIYLNQELHYPSGYTLVYECLRLTGTKTNRLMFSLVNASCKNQLVSIAIGKETETTIVEQVVV